MTFQNPLEEMAHNIATSLISQKSAGQGIAESLSASIAKTAQSQNLSVDARATLIPLVNKAYLNQTGADEFERATPESVAQFLYGNQKSASMETYHYKEFDAVPTPMDQAGMRKAASEDPSFANPGMRMNVAKTLQAMSYEDQVGAYHNMLRAKSASETWFEKAASTIDNLKMYGVDSSFISNAIWKEENGARDLQEVACAMFDRSPRTKSASFASPAQLELMGKQLYNEVGEFMEAYGNYKHASEVLAGKTEIHASIKKRGEVIVNA